MYSGLNLNTMGMNIKVIRKILPFKKGKEKDTSYGF